MRDCRWSLAGLVRVPSGAALPLIRLDVLRIVSSYLHYLALDAPRAERVVGCREGASRLHSLGQSAKQVIGTRGP